MNRHHKITYYFFYEMFHMPDKMRYIEKVMDSCKTIEQLNMVKEWGNKILWNHCDIIRSKLKEYTPLISFQVSQNIITRIKKLTNHINEHYDICVSNIK